jgi:hypothetical protein
MVFREEIYFASKLIAKLSCTWKSFSPFTIKEQLFYTFRTMELFYRTIDSVGGCFASNDDQKILVVVCFRIMYKFYRESPFMIGDDLCNFMKFYISLQSEKDFKLHLVKVERMVLNYVGWVLIPHKITQSDIASRFYESWEFLPEVKAPVNFQGPFRADMDKLIFQHCSSLTSLNAVLNVASFNGSSDFFNLNFDAARDSLKSMHFVFVERFNSDAIFANTVIKYVHTHSVGALPDRFQFNPNSEISNEAISLLNKRMVADFSRELTEQLRMVDTSMRLVYEKLSSFPLGLSEEEFTRISDILRKTSKFQHYAHKITKLVQVIDLECMSTCAALGQSIDSQMMAAVPLLKLSSQALQMRKRKASDISLNNHGPTSASPDLKEGETFTKIIVEKNHLMCTRVVSDPYVTPAILVKHRVDIIPAPDKVIVETYKVGSGSDTKPILISVDVKPSFLKAGEAYAAVYKARNAAANASFEACQACEAQDNVSPDNAIALAEASAIAIKAAADADDASFLAAEANKIWEVAAEELRADVAMAGWSLDVQSSDMRSCGSGS